MYIWWKYVFKNFIWICCSERGGFFCNKIFLKKEFELVLYYKGLKYCLEYKKILNIMILGIKVVKRLIFCCLKINIRFKVCVIE